MAFIYQKGPQGRNILVDASGRIISNSSASDAPFVYSYGPEGHPLSVDASGRLLIYDVNAGSGGGSGASSLNDLTDVILTSPVSGQFLQYDGLFWENVTVGLEDLNNVSGFAISGQFLFYNGSYWIPSDVILSLDDLTDVMTSGALETDALIYNSGIWKPSGLIPLIDSRVLVDSVNGQTGVVVLNIDDINDVVITAIANGEILKWNGSNWINNTLSEAGISAVGHTHALDDLSDVTISIPASGEILKYNGSIWINNTLSEAGISAVGHTHSLDDLSDVSTAGAASGEFLFFNGSSYVIQSGSLNLLSNVNTSGATNGEALVYSGGIWVPSGITAGAAALDDLTDVNTSGVSNGDVLAYSGTTWVPSGITFPVTSVNGETGVVSLILDDIADVTITAIASGEIIKWNGSAWINNTLAEAGIALSSHTHTLNDLSDVTISSPSGGQVLKFEGGFWSNSDNVPYRDRVSMKDTDFDTDLNWIYLIQTSFGAITGTIPGDHQVGDKLIFKDIDGQANTNLITIISSDGDTIDGGADLKITSSFASTTIVSDGTNWWQI